MFTFAAILTGSWILFFKESHKNIFHSTCFSRTLPLFHQEVESMSPTLEPRWAFMTTSSNNNTASSEAKSEKCLILLE